MAFDGITIHNIVKELNTALVGGRIYKIAQPEADELLLTVKHPAGQRRLFICADASLPLIYLTEQNKPSPMSAPNFCMVLRKHIQNGRITSITQPGLERIIKIEIEHLDEMGDLRHKCLMIEIMGKHSNIIFCDEENVIIDSIKHISGLVSSVREVLPGKDYFIPMTQDKKDPLATDRDSFSSLLTNSSQPVFKALYGSYTGLSPIVAQEICYRSQIDSDLPANALDSNTIHALYTSFDHMMLQVKNGDFSPNVIYEKEAPVEFCALPLSLYFDTAHTVKSYESMSALLESYYAEKNKITRIRQKSVDLRKIVQTDLERTVKKYDLQLRQMADTEKKDKYRIYGELINAFGYNIAPGSKSFEAPNYYDDNKIITVPLDPLISPSENSKKYFDKYGKLKRTYEALSELTKQVKEEIDHLESISSALDIAVLEEDLVEIKEELIESGYIRRKGGVKRVKITSKPFHYISSDGFHIYVGKNNFQNDELTFKFATGNDWWFHAKGIPGSHVLVKTNGETTLPDSTFEQAARLAAHYSKGSKSEKVEIDYTQKKNVKKPNSAKPGFVIYHTNYSMLIGSDISGIKEA